MGVEKRCLCRSRLYFLISLIHSNSSNSLGLSSTHQYFSILNVWLEIIVVALGNKALALARGRYRYHVISMLALTLDAASQTISVTTLLLPLDFVRPEVLVLAVLLLNEQAAGWRRLLLFLSLLNFFLVFTLTTLEVQVSQEHVSEVRILLTLIGWSHVVMNCFLDYDRFLAAFS